MKDLADHLTAYAAYHRDRRNIATHFVGIPMIVVGLAVLLARPSVEVGGIPLSAAVAVALGMIAFYARLDRRYAVAMTLVIGAAVAAGASVAARSTGTWLGVGAGLFVGGWAIQFVGHAFEGRKPAFVDDLFGLAVGPLFIVAEAGFALGLRTPVREAIEARVGPTRLRRPGEDGAVSARE
jgi:uncharacterized membrane protein YGL010W